MVSIIVPVYNVEAYIDRCLKSITAQSVRDIEIIVIEGLSTDSSLPRCRAWAQRDQRIQIHSGRDAGLGDARNKGLSFATGEYVMFVDSDDWLAIDCVEILLSLARRYDADIVCGDYFSCHFKTNELVHKTAALPTGLYQSMREMELYLLLGFPMTWGKLYKRSLWLENGIKTPYMRHEDCGIFPLLTFCAKKIVYMDQPIYYYTEFRENSLVNIPENRAQMPLAIQYALDGLAHRDKLKLFSSCMKLYAQKFIVGSMFEAQKTMDEAAYKDLIERPHREFLDRYFPDWEHNSLVFRATAIGSFGLRWIVHEALDGTKGLRLHLCFSSLIAQYVKPQSVLQVFHENQLRQQCVQNDVSGALLEILEQPIPSNQLFFIDFMEERYDILEMMDGNFCTDSPAFREANLLEYSIKRIVRSDSEEYWHLWEKACSCLVLQLKKSYPLRNIYLLRNRFAEKYDSGESLETYPNQAEIQKWNDRMEKMEQYFLKEIGRIHIIDLPMTLLYTEKRFKYGQNPEYANNILYRYVGMGIRLELMERLDSYEKSCNQDSGL